MNPGKSIPSGSQGSWLLEVSPKDAYHAFTIVDSGAAPARSSSDACTVVLEGKLYNERELAALAGSRNSASTNPADLVRRVYEQVGNAVVTKLKGIFALVIWDKQSRSVLAARDPLGVTPLFYATAPGLLLLAPSFETLLNEPRVSPAPNRLALAAHLLDLWPSSGETVLENVRRVPVGHFLKWDGRGGEPTRYWDPSESNVEVPADTGQLLERFRELLTRAVDRCLDIGPAGIFLSGGLDSGTVAAIAADRSRVMDLPSPHALSLVHPDPSLNEEPMQRRVACGLGIPQVLVRFERAAGSGGLLMASLDAAARSPAPPLNLWRPAYDALIDEAVRRGCTVILTGEGGDEWLVPRPLYAADRLAVLDLAGLYQLWMARRRAVPFPAVTTLGTVFWSSAARPLLRQAAGAGLQALSPSAARSYRLRRFSNSLPAWLAPDPHLRGALVELAVDGLPDPAPRALYEQDKRKLIGHARLGVLMEEWYEDGRGRGVRILEPLLDADLVEFLYHVPPQVLLRGGQTKWLARATLERRLPGLVPHWPKPVYADRFWLSLMGREGPNAWRRLGGVSQLAEAGVVDPGRFGSAVESASSSDFSTATQVWATCMLESWLRAHRSPKMLARRSSGGGGGYFVSSENFAQDFAR